VKHRSQVLWSEMVVVQAVVPATWRVALNQKTYPRLHPDFFARHPSFGKSVRDVSRETSIAECLPEAESGTMIGDKPPEDR
jgi:hypothetical protein